MMEENFIYHDNDFIIGTEESLLEAIKEHMFYNKIEDDEGIIDSYNNYWGLKEQLKTSPRNDLYMVMFHQMDGTPYICSNEKMAEEITNLVIKGELTLKNK